MTPFGANISSLLSTDRIANLIRYSGACAHLGGYIAEFGVYTGGSLEVLAKYNPGVNILAVDSFEGVPKESEHDYHREGDFAGVDYHAIAGYFKMMYPAVRIIKGYIPKVFDYFDENTRFSFTHCDLDMYQSIYSALEFLVPRTLTGGMILLDDYKVRSTPGCKKAIEDFFEKNIVLDVRYRGEVRQWQAEDAPTHNQYIIVI